MSDTPGEALENMPSGSTPLRSLGAAAAVFSGLVIVVLVLGFSVRQSTLGQGPVCASLPVDTGPGTPVSHAFAYVLGLAPGSKAVQAGPIQVCADHPSSLLRLAGVLASLPSALLALGALVIARKWFKSAREPNRFYTKQTARGLKTLGWYLAVGSVVVAVIESAAGTVVVTTLAHHVGWAPAELHFSVITLVIGLILIGFAHVIAHSAAMRLELETRFD
jgi:hypothetical protein